MSFERRIVHEGVARQVPLADGERGVAAGAQDLGQRQDVLVDLEAQVGEAGVRVGDARRSRPGAG